MFFSVSLKTNLVFSTSFPLLDVLYNAKRLKLILQPLRATHTKQEVVAQAKLDTWWYLVSRLGPKAAMNFDQVGSTILNTGTRTTLC